MAELFVFETLGICHSNYRSCLVAIAVCGIWVLSCSDFPAKKLVDCNNHLLLNEICELG